MHRHQPFVAAVLCAVVVSLLATAAPVEVRAQVGPTAFTYQGRLNDGGNGVDAATARMQFGLWDSEVGGHLLGTAWESYPVEITDGIFTTQVDFGESGFDGNARWLEIRVDVTGGTSYTLLAPRQPMTAAPVALHALHGGDNPWDIDGSNISYTELGNVGIGTDTPTSRLHVRDRDTEPVVASLSVNNGAYPGTAIYGQLDNSSGYAVHGKATIAAGDVSGVYGEVSADGGTGVLGRNANTSGSGYGAKGLVRSGSAYGLFGLNESASGDAIGVYGSSLSPTGFGGYFSGRGYFSGNVGIGVPNPTTALDVAGTVNMQGFRLGASPGSGWVLTSDASGIGTWQPAAGGGGYWSGGTGGIIYYNDGYVGIGTSNPSTPLYVYSAAGASAIKGRIDGSLGIAVEGRASSSTGDVTGVYGSSGSDSGKGVFGQSGSNTGSGVGVKGTSASPLGYGVFAENLATSGSAVGLFGKSNSANGFGGYFIGNGYFSGKLGVGTTSPSSALEVAGTATMGGIRLGSSATAGHVLTADASGNGTWQPAAGGGGYWSGGTGGVIYYNGGNIGVGTDSPSHPLHLVTDQSYGGYFDSNADTGYAHGLYGRAEGVANGVPGTVHYGVYGTAKNAFNNVGVYGTASGGTNDFGGYFEGNLYASGNAGIGETLPEAKLHVVQGSAADALRIEDESNDSSPFVITQSGDVGVGTASPIAKLDVAGSLKANGIRISSGAQTGHVLTSDAVGNGTWEPPSESFWQGVGSDIYYPSGNVGIGNLNPLAKAHIWQSGTADAFRVDDEAADSTPFVITANGSVGIGVESPSSPFQFNNSGCSVYFASLLASPPTTKLRAVLGSYQSSTQGSLGRILYNSDSGASLFYGVYGDASDGDGTVNYGVFGKANFGETNYAGYFSGDVEVTGTLSKGAGSFKIDHPLDPANRYLYHSFVESPDMMNIYNGNVVTDEEGRAVITLPDWFESLNRDFRYQLSVIDETDSDQFVQAKVVQKITDGAFTIRTSAPGVEVSWQVTGIRQDPFANAHRIPVEQDKPLAERGTYLHPEARGLPSELGVDRVVNPE